MRRSRFKQVLGVGLAVAASTFALAPLLASPASAAPEVIAAAGSDTTMDVMDGILAGTGAYNIHVPNFQTSALAVPGDDFCASISYKKAGSGDSGVNGSSNADGTVSPPAGSGDGTNALAGADAKTWPLNTAAAYGGRTVTDLLTTNASTTITSATAAFVAGDVGKSVVGTFIPLGATIVSQAGTTAVISIAATGDTTTGATAARTKTDLVTTNGSATVTSAATPAFTAADVNRAVTGTNIPAGTTIAGFTNATTVVLSKTATASGTGGTLNISSGFLSITGATGTHGGCVDIARRSSFNSGSVGSGTKESYAFGIDAVSAATASLAAPAALTLQQLRDIYNCNYNNWSQVGGSDMPIIRALPNFGSGTRSFFVNTVLGISSAIESSTVGWVPPVAGTIPAGAPGAGTAITCPAAIGGGNAINTWEENVGKETTSSAHRVDYQKYILPYSTGKFVFQANNSLNPTLDIRAGVRPLAIWNNTLLPTAQAALTVRWTGTDFRLNDATILPGTTGYHTVASAVSSAQSDNTITAAAASFSAADVGKYMQGAFINDGTVITAVSADGSTATILPGASAAGTGTVTVGYSVVSEGNPALANTGNLEFTGVRFVWNQLLTSSPSYVTARGLVGFNQTAGGAVSALCDGTDEGVVTDAGFLPLPAVDRDGAGVGNDTPVTCVKRTI